VPRACFCSLAGLLAVLAVLLAGCAELPRAGDASAFEFELRGRVAIRYRDEAATGNIAWRHARDADEMLITSSLGQGIARLVRDGGTVTLTTRDGRDYAAADAESLTEQVLGFRVPLSGLPDWVLGRPSSGLAQARRDSAGRLEELEQDGWRVSYESWSDDGTRPVRLTLAYPGMQLRLVVNEWQVR
jgi:outer membrane lipoprotein LolB